MNHSVSLEFRGLAVDAEISKYDPGVHTLPNGDPGYPPEGGECESFTWAVDDIDELLCWLEMENESVEIAILACYKYTGKLPPNIVMKIDREWGDIISEAATEHFWENQS